MKCPNDNGTMQMCISAVNEMEFIHLMQFIWRVNEVRVIQKTPTMLIHKSTACGLNKREPSSDWLTESLNHRWWLSFYLAEMTVLGLSSLCDVIQSQQYGGLSNTKRLDCGSQGFSVSIQHCNNIHDRKQGNHHMFSYIHIFDLSYKSHSLGCCETEAGCLLYVKVSFSCKEKFTQQRAAIGGQL